MIQIGMAQMEVIPGNPRANMKKMTQLIDRGNHYGLDLLVFPELALSGYVIGDLWEQEAFIQECVTYGEQLAKQTDHLAIIFGNVGVDKKRRHGDGRVRLYNAFFGAQNGSFSKPLEGDYNFFIKTLSPNYRFFNEERHFTSLLSFGQEVNKDVHQLISPMNFIIGGEKVTIGPLVCEDSWSENYSFNPAKVLQEKYNPHLFVNISCSPFTLGKNKRRNSLFAEQAAELQTPYLYVNCTGIQNNGKSVLTFDGQSTVYTKSGDIFSPLAPYEENIITIAFDPATKNVYPKTVTPEDSISQTSPIMPLWHEDEKKEIEEIYDALIYGIRKMKTHHGIDKVLIGVSGGIDSAVNAALYTAALGPDRVYLLTMPGPYTSKETRNMAEVLGNRLGCPFASFSISEGVTLTIKELSNLTFTYHDGSLQNLTLSSFVKENIQARDRSSRVLSAVAAALGGVFTCNGNKTEISIGYATLYGDLAGYLAATGDLWKYQMYELATYLNEKVFTKEVIPKETLEVVPSAELSDAQDVTKGLGDPLQYEYHDRLFKSFIEPWHRKTPEDILRAYIQGTLEELLLLPHTVSHYFSSPKEFIDDLERWWNLQSGFAIAKRIQSPPIIAVSRRSYGGDLQESQVLPYYTEEYFKLKERIYDK